jgi:uncharacterized membrane protein
VVVEQASMDRQTFIFGMIGGALIGVFGTGVPFQTIVGIPVHATLAFVSGVVTVASVIGFLVLHYRQSNAN